MSQGYTSSLRFIVPRVDLRAYRPEHSATRLLTKQWCDEHVIVPVAVAHGALIVAMVEPDHQGALVEQLQVFTGMKVEIVQASAEEIRDTILECYGAEN